MFRDNKKVFITSTKRWVTFLSNMFLTSDETCDYFGQLGFGVARFFFLKADRTQVFFFMCLLWIALRRFSKFEEKLQRVKKYLELTIIFKAHTLFLSFYNLILKNSEGNYKKRLSNIAYFYNFISCFNQGHHDIFLCEWTIWKKRIGH